MKLLILESEFLRTELKNDWAFTPLLFFQGGHASCWFLLQYLTCIRVLFLIMVRKREDFILQNSDMTLQCPPQFVKNLAEGVHPLKQQACDWQAISLERLKGCPSLPEIVENWDMKSRNVRNNFRCIWVPNCDRFPCPTKLFYSEGIFGWTVITGGGGFSLGPASPQNPPWSGTLHWHLC